MYSIKQIVQDVKNQLRACRVSVRDEEYEQDTTCPYDHNEIAHQTNELFLSKQLNEHSEPYGRDYKLYQRIYKTPIQLIDGKTVAPTFSLALHIRKDTGALVTTMRFALKRHGKGYVLASSSQQALDERIKRFVGDLLAEHHRWVVQRTRKKEKYENGPDGLDVIKQHLEDTNFQVKRFMDYVIVQGLTHPVYILMDGPHYILSFHNTSGRDSAIIKSTLIDGMKPLISVQTILEHLKNDRLTEILSANDAERRVSNVNP
jgi:hypothetical protein